MWINTNDKQQGFIFFYERRSFNKTTLLFGTENGQVLRLLYKMSERFLGCELVLT